METVLAIYRIRTRSQARRDRAITRLTRLLDGHRPVTDLRSALQAINEVTLDFLDTELRQ